MTITRKQLHAPGGSLTNACIIQNGDKELLFSYETLVGLAFGGVAYYQREGKANSRTTARHISSWAKQYPKQQLVSESKLQEMAK